MNIVSSISDMQQTARDWRRQGHAIGLVPTMGYLHDGHLSLVGQARQCSDRLVVSIFVNPTQFAPNEDLEDYPRDFSRDCALCESDGVDVVFAPSAEEMYPPDFSTWVEETALSGSLCGWSRPTHFRGVTTVVAKLFNAVLPDVAVFGQKDAQQALILQRMVRDLNIPVRIDLGPIRRDADGLAMSSRNEYLAPDERQRALSISRGLTAARNAFLTGTRSGAELCRIVCDEIRQAGGQIDYVELVARDSLQPMETVDRPALLAAAVQFGKPRLIDNVFLDP